MKYKIDLHVHTKASYDGDNSPREIVDFALKNNMKVIAITDHNSTKGIREALEYSKEKNIEIIPGIEIRCDGKEYGTPYVDILGIFINNNSRKLGYLLKQLKKGIKPDIKQAIQAIKDSKGIPIIAHPGIYFGNVNKLIKKFVEFGGKGLEVEYPYNKIHNLDQKKIIKKFKKIANENNLFASGGSDFHGLRRKVDMGECGISKEKYAKLKEFSFNNFKNH